MAAALRPAAATPPMPEPGFPLPDAAQCPATRAGTEVLLRGTRCGEERDVAARPVAGQARWFFRNFAWALALAGRWDRGGRRDRGRWPRLGPRGLGLDPGGWQHRLGVSRALVPAVAIASGLVPAALLAAGRGPVALRGMPAPPASSGALAGGAAVTCLGPLGQEPVFTALEQAAPAAGVPAATSGRQGGWLTQGRGEGRLSLAHGRDCSRAPRRRGGGTSRRHFAPTTEKPVAGDQAARTGQRTPSDSKVPCSGGRGEE
jgi:hypothetical protein